MRKVFGARRFIWGMLLSLVSAVAFLSYFAGTRYVAAVAAVDETLAVQVAIDGTLSLLKDAETGERGYLLTGDEQFLEPYRAARDGLPLQLANLESVARADVIQAEHARKLSDLALSEQTFIERVVALRRDGQGDQVSELVQSGKGKQLMDAIRAESSAMWVREQTTLMQRRAQANTAELLATWGVGFGALLSIVLAALSYVRTSSDMRTLQRAAGQLRASEEHFRLLTENTGDLVRLLDPKGQVTYVSPSVRQLLGFDVDEFQALAARTLMHPDELQIASAILYNIETGTLNSGVSTYRLRHKDGDYRWFEVFWTVLRDADGSVNSIHTVGRDVTERRLHDERIAARAEQLRTQSLRDELTKLYNRRGFLQVAGEAYALALRDGASAALIFIDLNGMKAINDELGHDVGDAALRDAAEVIQEALRPTDIAARLGGDEFVAFARDFTLGDLSALRGRVRALADQREALRARSNPDSSYRLSMSVGAAFATVGAVTTLEQLIEQADAAMYEQKRARRDRGGISIVPPMA
jgi:diguanylate cyclase (GGDEF)-like protein/PAS domain S-box-containing protein